MMKRQATTQACPARASAYQTQPPRAGSLSSAEETLSISPLHIALIDTHADHTEENGQSPNRSGLFLSI